MAILGIMWTGFVAPPPASASTYVATPSNYRTLLNSLAPGDTLRLTAGNYPLLTLRNLNGTPSGWITVTGPETGAAAVIQGDPCCNTVQLYGCSYVAIKHLTIDGRSYAVDGINSKDYVSHDILIEGCRLINLGAGQGTIGISTKQTAWNWTIRNNTIIEPGTGLYLGNSAGDAPFINGVIEGNYVVNPIGYCMEIKNQLPYTFLAGMPSGPNRTIIRNNVFIKDERPAEAGDRPNLLVGPFPTSGPGANDLYEIYGNFLYNNPREALFQGSGRMTLHDNVFVATDPNYTAIYLTDHNGALAYATVYNNTIYGPGTGITFASPPRTYGLVTGNLIFTDTPIALCGSCTGVLQRDNVTAPVADAGQYVNQPSTTLGAMDFYPRSNCTACVGAPLDLSTVTGDRDYSFDFNGTPKGSFATRGAYAGSGVNPGWQLTGARKVGGPSSGGSTTADTILPSAPQRLRPR
jgi:hypothetical protein